MNDKYYEDAKLLWDLPCTHAADYLAMDCGECGPLAVAAALRELDEKLKLTEQRAEWANKMFDSREQVLSYCYGRIDKLKQEVERLKIVLKAAHESNLYYQESLQAARAAGLTGASTPSQRRGKYQARYSKVSAGR